ncbi:chitinase 1-like [Cryptomeria japonica]|uniref:chitinase 1-like n=1 Tax=Cryptomeria japonica TaxID=3369 RepID=UPI0027D9F2DF|nr:chitinase 1-like [Cryptomeria japonica]
MAMQMVWEPMFAALFCAQSLFMCSFLYTGMLKVWEQPRLGVEGWEEQGFAQHRAMWLVLWEPLALGTVKFSDVPIIPGAHVDFILAFAIDYSWSGSSPTNRKCKHKKVRVALSLGGDSVGKTHVQLKPLSVSSWVKNAVSSLTKIIKQYHLDGIDIDYEHFDVSDPGTFAVRIGQLITQLKQKKVITLASISLFDDPKVQSHYCKDSKFP